MKLGKKSWLLIYLVVVMCVSTLGGTFAYFTDEVTTTSNIVQSGNLDAEMQWANGKQSPASASWKDASQGAVFDYQLWEPGYTQVRHLHVKNAGNLAFKYQLSIAAGAEVSKLSDVIDVYCISPARQISSRKDLENLTPVGTLTEALAGLRFTGGTDALLPGEETTLTIALKMQEEAGNEYQNLSIGSDFAVQLLATQYAYEEDSFGKDYDANATFGNNFKYFNASAAVPGIDGNGRLTKAVVIGTDADPMQAYVPAGVKLVPGTKVLTMTITRMAHRDYSIPMYDGQFSTSYDVHIEGIAEDNDKPITVDMGSILPEGLKDTSVEYYHVENDTPKKMKMVDSLSGNNQFTYDAATGSVTLSVCTFSEITQLVDPQNPWNGTADTAWYDAGKKEFLLTEEEQLAGLGKLVAEGNTFEGKTIKLGADMNLGAKAGRVFLPIGYDESNPSNLGAFKGIFDGEGYVIRDLYQNTWNITGNYDGTHYKLSMGLFGLIEDGTVEDLILYRFAMEGEYTPMGCVAGRANGGTFKDIRLIECHPATYNTGVGGIVGNDVSESAGAKYVFENIKIDASNKISALWGTYDAACGGLMGFVNDQSNIDVIKCEIGAEMDVYNDVCGNYQYYQYRYSGMIFGTVGENSVPNTDNIHCTGVEVYYDDWLHHYYCEFEENTLASYSEDYQFSRIPHSELKFNDKNGNGRVDDNEVNTVTGCIGHDHSAAEDKQAVHLPFKQLLTGYGWGASPKTDLDGVTWKNYDYSVTYQDGTEVLLVEYVKSNASDYSITHQSATDKINGVSDRWVNAGGTAVTKIPTGNTADVTVYADWLDTYVARFVDQFGNLIAEVEFQEGATTIKEPDFPEIGDFKGQWEEYTLGNSDITIKPAYAYTGKLVLTPVDDPVDGATDYYKVQATDALDETTTIPGYFNGLPVKIVEKLYKNEGIWDFGSDVKTIIISEGVEELQRNSLGYTKNLTTVKLPSTIKKLGKNVFSRNTGDDEKAITIEYNGTMAEWNAVEKDGDWHNGLETGTKVICSDGYFELTAKEYLWGAYETYDWKGYPNS